MKRAIRWLGIGSGIVAAGLLVFFAAQGAFAASPGEATDSAVKPVPPKPFLKTKVEVKTIAYQPAPLKAGTPFNLSIEFANTGLVEIPAGLQYSLSCQVLSGGPSCPINNSVMTLNKSIPPGESRSAFLAGINADAGQYKLTVTPMPGKGMSVTLNVAPKIIPRPAPSRSR